MWETEWALVGLIGGLSVAGILEYFSISKEGLLVMSIMLIVDFIFWIVAAKVRGEAIESKKWQDGLVRKVSRWVIPFIVAWWLKWTWMGWIEELNTAILWMIVFSELYSVIGHIYSINYKEELPELDSIKLLLNWIAKFLKNLVNKTDEVINKEWDEETHELPED